MFADLQVSDIIKTIKGLEHIEWDDLTAQLKEAQTIYCYGTGFSQRRILDEFAKNLLQLGKRAITIPNKTELDMAMKMITPQDVVLLASLSGETENIKENIFMWTLKNVPPCKYDPSRREHLCESFGFCFALLCDAIFRYQRKKGRVVSHIISRCWLSFSKVDRKNE